MASPMKQDYANAIRLARKHVRAAEKRVERLRKFIHDLRAEGGEKCSGGGALREAEKFLHTARQHLQLIEAGARDGEPLPLERSPR